MTWALALVGWCAVSVGAIGAEERTIAAAEAIELALENDSSLRLASLSLTVAELRLDAARSALYLPSLSLSLSPPQVGSSGLGKDVGASIAASLPLPWGQGDLTAHVGLNYDIATSTFSKPTWLVSLSGLLDLVSPGGGVSSLASNERTAESTARALAAAKTQLVISTLQTYQSLLSKATQADQDRQSVDRLQADLTQVQALAADGYKGDQDLNEAKILLLDAKVRAERSAAAYAADLEAFCREVLGLSQGCGLEPLDLSMSDLLATAHELLLGDVPDSAVDDTAAVRSARQEANDAQTALREAKGSIFPSLNLSGKVDATEWKIAVGVSLDLFSASRSADVRIAVANVAVAEQRLSSALESARNRILDLKASLLSAVRSGESLDLETEKWRLQEKLMAARRDAGTLTNSDWAALLEQRDGFAVDAAGRATTLLVAYLTYRDALGMKLDWEEWLQ